MALLVGMAFAANTSLAAVSFTGGATPVAVLLTRTVTAVLILAWLLRARGVPWALPPRQRSGSMALGCLFATYAYCILAAIQYLPLGVVVATFYTFPIFIALIEWFSGQEPFSARTAIALGIAFVGVLCALNVSAETFGGIGLLLCLAGALSVAIVMVFSARVRNGGDSRPITLHMLLTALAIFATVALTNDSVALPHTPYAWFGFLGAPAFYTFGIIMLFVVNAEIGPVKAAMIMNIEPATSVALGYLLLDQHLALIQLAGIAIIIGTVLWMESRKYLGGA